MIILKINVGDILRDYSESQSIITSHPNTPFPASCSFESMQSPARKQAYLLHNSRLLEGVKNVRDFWHEISSNAACITGLIKALYPFVPETPYSHFA